MFSLASMLVLGGCFNDRGISARYYNDCEEYYDYQGFYHKKCDPNIAEYSEIKDGVKQGIKEVRDLVPGLEAPAEKPRGSVE